MTACAANDALCLEVRGTEQTRIRVGLHCRTRQSILATPADWSIANAASFQERTFTIGELLAGSDGFRMGKVPSWVRMHRAVPCSLYTVSGRFGVSSEPGFYYVRVRQENGQMAWSSPIWVES